MTRSLYFRFRYEHDLFDSDCVEVRVGSCQLYTFDIKSLAFVDWLLGYLPSRLFGEIPDSFLVNVPATNLEVPFNCYLHGQLLAPSSLTLYKVIHDCTHAHNNHFESDFLKCDLLVLLRMFLTDRQQQYNGVKYL